MWNVEEGRKGKVEEFSWRVLFCTETYLPSDPPGRRAMEQRWYHNFYESPQRLKTRPQSALSLEIPRDYEASFDHLRVLGYQATFEWESDRELGNIESV